MKFIMNFLRSPFQFRSSDQSNKKQDSTTPTVENMFIDPTTGISADPKWRATSPGIGASSSVPGSPRLQHRVPGFENNGSHPNEMIHEPTMPQNSPKEEGEKPQRVRVVPIKVESVDDSSSPKRRPGAFHSSSGTIPRSSQFGPLHPNFEELHNRKRHSSGPATHKKNEPTESKPKICNIPIFIEGRDTPVVPKTSPSSQNVPVHNVTIPDAQTTTVKQNGGNLAKCSTKSKQKQEAKQNNLEISLKQISHILSELQALKTGVDEFKGVPQDKQYRYLDEMLTRCMLKLDNVETHGDDEVRASRKAAIKAVERCITDLESRAQANAKSEQPAATDQVVEKRSPSELADTTNGEEMNISQEQTDVYEGIRKTDEIVNEVGSSSGSCILNDQSVIEDSSGPSSSEGIGRDSTESKPELTEVSQIEKIDVSANQDSGDVASESMDLCETAVKTSEEKTQFQDNQPIDSMENTKVPELLAEASSEPMEVEVSNTPSQFVDLPTKQNEPMDSGEVPETKVKLDSQGTTVVELIKEPVSLENKNSSVSTEIDN